MISSRFLERLPRLRFGSLRERISVLYAGLFTIILVVMLALVSAGIERFGEDGRDSTADQIFRETVRGHAQSHRYILRHSVVESEVSEREETTTLQGT